MVTDDVPLNVDGIKHAKLAQTPAHLLHHACTTAFLPHVNSITGSIFVAMARFRVSSSLKFKMLTS